MALRYHKTRKKTKLGEDTSIKKQTRDKMVARSRGGRRNRQTKPSLEAPTKYKVQEYRVEFFDDGTHDEHWGTKGRNQQRNLKKKGTERRLLESGLGY